MVVTAPWLHFHLGDTKALGFSLLVLTQRQGESSPAKGYDKKIQEHRGQLLQYWMANLTSFLKP